MLKLLFKALACASLASLIGSVMISLPYVWRYFRGVPFVWHPTICYVRPSLTTNLSTFVVFRHINRPFMLLYVRLLSRKGVVAGWDDIWIGILMLLSVWVLDIPYLTLVAARIYWRCGGNLEGFKEGMWKVIESGHRGCEGLRIIYDGERLYINGYDEMIRRFLKHPELLGSDGILSLSKEMSALPKDVQIKNMMVRSLNMRGQMREHGLVRIYVEGKYYDMSMTRHPYQGYVWSYGERIYLHRSQNNDALIIDSPYKLVVGPAAYYAFIFNISKCEKQFINSQIFRSKIVGCENVKNIGHHDLILKTLNLSRISGLSPEVIFNCCTQYPYEVIENIAKSL